MASVDLNAETKALRGKSPLGSRSVLIAQALGTVFIGLLLTAIFFSEDTPNAPRWAIVAMCCVAILVTAAFMFAFFYRAKLLIDRGVIVQAKLEDSIQVRRNVRLRLAANHDGKDLNFPIYVPLGLAREVEGFGYVWLVIDPLSPKRAVPLWEFAGINNIFAVASGSRGILNTK